MLTYLKKKIRIIMIRWTPSSAIQVINDIGLIYINSKLNKLPPFAFNYVFLFFLRGTEFFIIMCKAFINNTDFLSNLT